MNTTARSSPDFCISGSYGLCTSGEGEALGSQYEKNNLKEFQSF